MLSYSCGPAVPILETTIHQVSDDTALIRELGLDPAAGAVTA